MRPTAALQQLLAVEMEAALPTEPTVAESAAGWSYYSRPGHDGAPVYCRCRLLPDEHQEQQQQPPPLQQPQHGEESEEVLLDTSPWGYVGAMKVSPCHQLLAFTAADEADGFGAHVKDLRTGRVSTHPMLGAVVSLDWGEQVAGGGAIALYFTTPDELMRSCRVERLRVEKWPAEEKGLLGAPGGAAGSSWGVAPGSAHDVVLTEADDAFFVDVRCSKDGAAMVISVASKVATEVHVLPSRAPPPRDGVAPPAPVKLAPRRAGVDYFVEHAAGVNAFLVLTNAPELAGAAGGGGGDGVGGGEYALACVDSEMLLSEAVTAAAAAEEEDAAAAVAPPLAEWRVLAKANASVAVADMDVVRGHVAAPLRNDYHGCCCCLYESFDGLPRVRVLQLSRQLEGGRAGGAGGRGIVSVDASRTFLLSGEPAAASGERARVGGGGRSTRTRGISAAQRRRKQQRATGVSAKAAAATATKATKAAHAAAAAAAAAPPASDREVRVPTGGELGVCALIPGVNADYRATSLRFGLSGPLVPQQLYDLELGGSWALDELPRQGPSPFGSSAGGGASGADGDGDGDGGVLEASFHRRFATSADGVAVPLSLVRCGDAQRLQSEAAGPPRRPRVLLLGYGSYGTSLDVGFSPEHVALLRRGWTLAFAHVRGGGELGRAWYDAGRGARKRRAVDDFLSCMEALVAGGHCAAGDLAVKGASAGGVLVGAALNELPELLGAAVASVPFVDVLGAMRDEGLPLTIHERDEWGHLPPLQSRAHDGGGGDHGLVGGAAAAVALAAVQSYDPYFNVLQGLAAAGRGSGGGGGARDVPVLVTTALDDSHVPFWGPLKWVAALREARQCSPSPTAAAPVLLRVGDDGGHYGAAGLSGQLADAAFEQAFLLASMGDER